MFTHGLSRTSGDGPLSTVRPGFSMLGISPWSVEEELKAMLERENEETQNAKEARSR
jgi:hypothetical protein